jgi:hypothetical protein
LNRFEFQQTHVFTLFPVGVRFLGNFDVLSREDVRTLEQATRVDPTCLIRP